MIGHALKRQIAGLLERLCFDGAESVTWIRWTDPVRVEDAVLRADVLQRLCRVPLEISGGYVGSLLVDVTDDGALSIDINRLLVVAVIRDTPADSLAPSRLLSALLKPLKKLLRKFVASINFKVKNLHVRFENCERHIVCGVVCRNFQKFPTDSDSGNFRSLGAYFQADQTELISTTDLAARTARFRRLMNKREDLGTFLVAPCSGRFQLDSGNTFRLSFDAPVVLHAPPQLSRLADLFGGASVQTGGNGRDWPANLAVVVDNLRVRLMPQDVEVIVANITLNEDGLEISGISDSWGVLEFPIEKVVVENRTVHISCVKLRRGAAAEPEPISQGGDQEVYSPRSIGTAGIGGYDSDWQSVAESVFFEAASPRAALTRKVQLPDSDWQLHVDKVSVEDFVELHSLSVSSAKVAVERVVFQSGKAAKDLEEVVVDFKEQCIRVGNLPDFGVHATNLTFSWSGSVGVSLLVKLPLGVSVELDELTLTSRSIAMMRGEVKLPQSDCSLVVSSIVADLVERTCDQVSVTLVESGNIEMLRLSLSEISVYLVARQVCCRQVNMRNLFSTPSRSADASYLALKDIVLDLNLFSVNVQAVMGHIGSDVPALVRKLASVFVPPSTERYTVENGLWTAIELTTLTSSEEKFIARVPPHTTTNLDLPRKFHTVLVRDLTGRVLGQISRGKRHFQTFYFCRPVLGTLTAHTIRLLVAFAPVPTPGANFLSAARRPAMRLIIASVRLVLAPSEQISVHAEMETVTVASLRSLRDSAVVKMSLDSLTVIDRSNPADPLVVFGHTEIWKEAERVFVHLPKVKIHADLEIAEHLNTIKSVFQSSFSTLRAFSTPALPAVLLVAAFELELYAKRLFKVLALDEAPLHLRQCVLRESVSLADLADWYVDEISGQWLQLALHIDVYGQPMAVVRSLTAKVRDLCSRIVASLV